MKNGSEEKTGRARRETRDERSDRENESKKNAASRVSVTATNVRLFLYYFFFISSLAD